MNRLILLMPAFLLFATNVEAQDGSIRNRRSPHSISDLPLSRKGKPIVSQFSDPFTSSEQVEAIGRFLRKPSVFQWNASTTIRKVHEDLAKHLPVELNHRALEEIGLSPDDGGSNSLDDSLPPMSNPFADTGDAQVNLLNARKIETESTDRWWESRRRTRVTKVVVTNGAKLTYFLQQWDLTLNLDQGQLQITTIEQAEQAMCIRIYDVTPLVETSDLLASQPSRSLGLGGSMSGMGGSPYPMSLHYGSLSDYQSLMDLIQTTIVPDTWEALGGPSTMAPFSTKNRSSLVIAGPLMVHWQIEDLLNRLNR